MMREEAPRSLISSLLILLQEGGGYTFLVSVHVCVIGYVVLWLARLMEVCSAPIQELLGLAAVVAAAGAALTQRGTQRAWLCRPRPVHS